MPTLDDIWLDTKSILEDEPALSLSRRRYRIMVVCAVGLSYAIDTLFLFLFSATGAIPLDVPVFYGCAGLSHVAIFSLLHRTGLSERARNPHLPLWQMAFAIAAQLIAITLAPQIKTFFFAIIFIIFAFGSLRLTLKEALVAWLLTSLALAATVTALGHSPIALAHPTPVQATIVWSSFSTILLRCILLGYYSTMLRVRLFRKNTDLTEQMESAREMATRDALTGALNRHAILPLVDEQIHIYRRTGTEGSVAMIDVDSFKAINDRHGHLVGDAVLRELVGIVRADVRMSDKVGRFGGEEFLLLLPSTGLEGLPAWSPASAPTSTAPPGSGFPPNWK